MISHCNLIKFHKNISIVALIPARSGSKRIKDKNIRIIDEHPLIAYTIYIARKSNVFKEVIVSTDSITYGDIAQYYGATVSIRPGKFAGDNSPDIEWVTYVLNELKINGKNYDYFSILRPTSPFRTTDTIKRAIYQFLKSNNVDSIRAVEICSQHPAKMWFIRNNVMEPVLKGKNGDVPWHSSQFNSLPRIYVQNASLEIAKTSNVYTNKSISGDRIMPFFTEGYEGFDLNTTYDWEYAKYLLKTSKVILPKIPVIPYKHKYNG